MLDVLVAKDGDKYVFRLVRDSEHFDMTHEEVEKLSFLLQSNLQYLDYAKEDNSSG